MTSTEIFYSSIREIIESGNIERLMRFKKQIESDLSRIGNDERLMEKYEFLCKAISMLYDKNMALTTVN
jgi:hypothetical protein